MKRAIKTVLWLLLACAAVGATDRYASPTGSGSTCSLASPCSLETVLSGSSPAVAGDTIYLRGGTYTGKFSSSLNGSAGNLITVRSYPGEWAVLEGYTTSTITSTIDDNDTAFAVADASTFPVSGAFDLTFHDGTAQEGDEEIIHCTRSGNNLTVTRAWNGTTAVGHTSGATVVLGGSGLAPGGSYTVYRDFEVKNTDTVREQTPLNAQNSPHLRAGVVVSGNHLKFVNLVVHDVDGGFFCAVTGVGNEYYGNLVYNNGYVAGGVHNGHGFYVIYSDATEPALIKENIIFNNCAIGIKNDSQNGNAVNIDHTGVVSFNNGSWAQTASRRWQLQAAANNGVADDITVDACYLYAPAGTNTELLKLGLGGVNNGALSVTNSWLGGNGIAATIEKWTPITFTGNTVHAEDNVGGGNDQMVFYTPRAGASVTWNNNTYWNATPGAVGYYYDVGSSSLSFATWKTTSGFDAASTQTASEPTANWVFIRTNAYDPNRFNVIVYNWTDGATASVDVSGLLPDGRKYSLYSVEDGVYPSGTPTQTGTVSGGTISVPMNGSTVAQPVGWGTSITSVRSEFAAFVLMAGATPTASLTRAVLVGRAGIR